MRQLRYCLEIGQTSGLCAGELSSYDRDVIASPPKNGRQQQRSHCKYVIFYLERSSIGRRLLFYKSICYHNVSVSQQNLR